MRIGGGVRVRGALDARGPCAEVSEGARAVGERDPALVGGLREGGPLMNG